MLYLGLCFAGAMFLNGIKIASAGETEILPNGKEKDNGMILYPIAKWLDQHKMKPILYQGKELEKLLAAYKKRFGTLWPMDYMIYSGVEVQYNSEGSIEILVPLMEKIKQEGVMIDVLGRNVTYYKEFKEYKFSKYIRLPTLGCIRCMPSFWSPVTYWAPMILVMGYHDWQWLLWLTNIPIVSFIGTYLATKYK